MFPFSLLGVMKLLMLLPFGGGGGGAQKPEKINSNSNSAAKRMHIELYSQHISVDIKVPLHLHRMGG